MSQVSIIMPAYNAVQFIGSAVESVLAQEWQDWELLVVDDGSTDSTWEALAEYEDSRILKFRQNNSGVSAARNRALREMNGDFFCFLDADDLLPAGSIASRMELFNDDEDLLFVDGSVQVRDLSMSCILEERQHTFSGNPFRALLQIDNSCFFGPTWMIRRIPGKEYGFKVGLTHGEDLLFYMDLSREGGQYSATSDITYLYRTGNTSAMSDLNGLWKGYRSILSEITTWPEVDSKDRQTFSRKISAIMIKSYLASYRPLSALKVILDYFRL